MEDSESTRGRAGELLYEYLAAIPDIDRLRELLHPDVSFTLHVPSGKTNTGRERILRGLTKEFATFYRSESFQLEVLESFGLNDRAAARFTITAETEKGPYRNDYAIIARFVDDLLFEAWEYCDSASARIQLGVAARER
ncbi:nuclear transport factor 2 family protein [Mycobacterium sp. NPDC051804]|uniref:nuclear transport factor 2 family protein n=1 Tax=Mycobacterium sp. NPDC051804 TaxID=3364295 RepID=UPI0037B9F3EE